MYETDYRSEHTNRLNVDTSRQTKGRRIQTNGILMISGCGMIKSVSTYQYIWTVKFRESKLRRVKSYISADTVAFQNLTCLQEMLEIIISSSGIFFKLKVNFLKSYREQKLSHLVEELQKEVFVQRKSITQKGNRNKDTKNIM